MLKEVGGGGGGGEYNMDWELGSDISRATCCWVPCCNKLSWNDFRDTGRTLYGMFELLFRDVDRSEAMFELPFPDGGRPYGMLELTLRDGVELPFRD
jgi:hypothetical protein